MPAVVEVQLMHMIVRANEIHVLLIVERGLISIQGASNGCGRRSGEHRQVVVMPAVVEVQLMHMIVRANEIDVLLIVEGGLVSVQGAPSGCGRRSGEHRQVVVMPLTVEIQLMHMIVRANEIDVLLVVKGRLIPVKRGPRRRAWCSGNSRQVGMDPLLVEIHLVDMVVRAYKIDVLLAIKR